MTRLLASVRDLQEAEAAVQAGADIIDLKEPAAGALGALPRPCIEAIVDRVGGRTPVSATVGDLPDDPTILSEAVRSTSAAGVDYVKVGFFSYRRLDACLRAISGLTAERAVVAVLFADRAPPLDALPRFATAGFAGVMLDTADKRTGRLLDHSSPKALGRFVTETRALGLFCGLAGSLRLEDVPVLLPLDPDYLGFRGALCRDSQRGQRLDRDRLLAVREALPPNAAPGTAIG
jgi:dihydroneopterin aldolase